jgi:hypothetical protein
MSGPFVLVPTTITDAMVTSSTIAEPAAGETAWNPATAYTVGQEAILTATHRVYTNLLGGVNATSPELALTGATPRWLDTRPTNKWACFDGQINTQSSIVTPLTIVLVPGLFNCIAFYGLDGSTITITIKDAPGGSVFYSYTASLQAPPIDYYDYYFGVIRPLTKLLRTGITPFSNPEVTITITAGAGITVKAGMIAFGNLRSLLSVEGTGGTNYGAKAKPITYSYIGTDLYGNTKIIRRTKATDMDIQVTVPIADADYALISMQDVLDVPAAWIATDAANYSGLNIFGLASGDVTYGGPTHAIITINVRGLS